MEADERASQRRGGSRVVDLLAGSSGQPLLGAVACALGTRTIDLVLLDVRLPDVSGLEVCRALRANPCLHSTRIVMLTAAAQQDDVMRGLAAGADDYLTKPFSPVRLLSLVNRMLPSVAWHPE